MQIGGSFFSMSYIEILVETINSDVKEIILAQLSSIGFDGFEETTNQLLKAFIPETGFNKKLVEETLHPYAVSYTINTVPEQNWNALWESNFEPVIVTGFVGVRASFHAPVKDVQHEIIITPKMSFGTGHHATTYMMMQLMKGLDFNNKKVFDFGTGTGILAILAEKLGAASITAIDNDDWCIENATENILQNRCKNIHLSKNNTAEQPQQFHIVIANINKNIILSNLSALTKNTLLNGTILLSGLLQEDEKDILAATHALHWKHVQTINKDTWIAMQFVITK